MKQYEYEVHEYCSILDIENLLKRKGIEGWRCSQIVKQDRDYWAVILEREK